MPEDSSGGHRDGHVWLGKLSNDCPTPGYLRRVTGIFAPVLAKFEILRSQPMASTHPELMSHWLSRNAWKLIANLSTFLAMWCLCLWMVGGSDRISLELNVTCTIPNPRPVSNAPLPHVAGVVECRKRDLPALLGWFANRLHRWPTPSRGAYDAYNASLTSPS